MEGEQCNYWCVPAPQTHLLHVVRQSAPVLLVVIQCPRQGHHPFELWIQTGENFPRNDFDEKTDPCH